MNKEILSNKQGISMIALFIMGTSSIMVAGIEAKQDAWLAMICSILLAIPIANIFAYLYSKFPEKNLFEIFQICFGKFLGIIISIVYTWYFFDTGVAIIHETNHFIINTTLDLTPQIFTILCIMFLCTWMIKNGLEAFGRWVNFFIIIVMIFVLIIALLLIPEMNINNIQPIMGTNYKTFFSGVKSSFVFPFGEIVVFTMVFSIFQTKASYKIYTKGLLLGGLILVVITFSNIAVLGINEIERLYHPSYFAVSKIHLFDFIQRMEIVAALVFIIGGFVKICVYTIAICKSVTTLFGFKEYSFIVTPIVLLMINLSVFRHNNIITYYEWVSEVWFTYSFPFQVIIPIILFIVSVIRNKICYDR